VSAAPQRGNGPTALVLVLLTAAALLLRLLPLDYSLPHQLEPDHGLVRTAAWLDRPNEVQDENPFAGPTPIYPWLLPRIVQALPGSSYPKILAPVSPLADHLASASAPFVRTRFVAALLSVLAIAGLYLVARRALPKGPALFAVALMATSVLLQNYGQQGRAHAAVAGLTVVAMAFVVAIPRAPTWPNYLGAGVAGGLALGCLQTGGFVVPALLVAHALSRRPRSTLRLLAALALVASAVPLFYPGSRTFFPIKKEGAWPSTFAERVRMFAPGWEGVTGIPKSLAGSEPVITALALVGLAFALWRLTRRREDRPPRERIEPFLVCGAFVVPLVVFWATFFPFRPRYLTSLLPFLAILAAYGGCEAASLLLLRVSSARGRAAAATALALLALGLPAWVCVRLALLRREPDTAQQAARWLEQHVDREKASVALGLLVDLPIPEERASIEAIPEGLRSHWQRYQSRLDPPEPSFEGMRAWRIRPLTLKTLVADKVLRADEVHALLEKEDPDYVVLSDRGPESTELDQSYIAVRALYGEAVARFPPLRPGSGGGPYPAYDLGPDALSVILRAQTWGFPIEIYAKRER
jgi:hypothetical protein